MENSCRLCLDENCTIKCILSATDEVNCFWDVRDLVKEAVGIEIRSKDPVRGLCGACVNMLHSVVKFKRKCHETNRIVLEMTVPDEAVTTGYFVEVEETKKVFEFSDFSDHSDNGDDLFESMIPKIIPKKILEEKEMVEDLLIPLPERKKKKRNKPFVGYKKRRDKNKIWNCLKRLKKYQVDKVDDQRLIDGNGAVGSSSQIKIEDESQEDGEIGNSIFVQEIKVEKENDYQYKVIDPLVDQVVFPDNMKVKEEPTAVGVIEDLPIVDPDSTSAVHQTPKTLKAIGFQKPEKRKYTKRRENAENKKQISKTKPKTSGLCDICGVHYSKIKNHIAQHDPTLKHKYKCDICGKGFVRNFILTKHMKSHGDPLSCSICNAKLKTKKTLLQHLKTHSDEFPFKCDICGRGFRHKKNLPAHKRTHTGEKPFLCQICDQRFTSRPAFRQHMRTRHDEK
ncbi:hypothetical protein DMENIID0001_137490 [Sergentomyia squamirostris]